MAERYEIDPWVALDKQEQNKEHLEEQILIELHKAEQMLKQHQDLVAKQKKRSKTIKKPVAKKEVEKVVEKYPN